MSESTAIHKTDPQVLDGTIVAYQPIPQQGTYVTVAGRSGEPTIIAFDLADLAVLNRAAEASIEAAEGTDPDDLARITQAGIVLLPEMLPELRGTEGADQ
ncbi:hypothetical protein TPB0596_46390 [Tsukamurella pulmonis]|uniref:hypothetical protein n=1 Tax=Tsukamurella pulmonis TaxID=47312 RepID=UPI001EDFF69B|nr:hypothetical protein [Tsukamurella pulmonis]BDD84876.1 hypothetical protein TPB0596_46390 [Tsukamurella pulmonis]